MRQRPYTCSNSRYTWRLEPHRPDSHVANLRLSVAPEFRGQGFGRVAVEDALWHAKLAGYRRVEATPYVDNPASCGLFESMPHLFQLEGIKRGAGVRDGQLVNTRLYAWVDWS